MDPVMGAAGVANTVNGNVLLHPSADLVYVKVTDPDETPETIPPLVIVAIDVLLLVQVPFVEGITLAVEPTHTDEAPLVTGLEGMALIFTFEDADEVHTLMLVTVKEYVVPGGKPVTLYDVPEPL
jgi:hypothetical protein